MVQINHYGPREVEIITGRYHNGRLAIELVTKVEPYAMLSVNVPGVDIDPDEFLVKTWSENEGLLTELLAAGVIKHTGRSVDAGGLGPMGVYCLT